MRTLQRGLRGTPTWQLTLFIALVALGFLIAAQLRAEAPRVRYTTQERLPLVETVLALQAQQDALKERIIELRARLATAEEGTIGSDLLVSQLNAALLEARVAAGIIALEGPGIVLQLEDSPGPIPPTGALADYRVTAIDVRSVVEELWLAGAEAISVNGERVVHGTAVLDIGGAVLLNAAYLAPPYQIAAIGPPDIYEVLAASPGFIEFIRARVEPFGIRISFAQPESIVVPAYAGAAGLRYARPPVPSPSPVP
jgi:uncharacterized protein YlxW (UPF0749 family)